MATEDPSLRPDDDIIVRCSACEELLIEAEQTLQKQDDALFRQADTITYLENYNARLQRSLETSYEELEKQDAWYNSPTLWSILALSAGVVIGAEVSK